jgi:glycosyltransferase Alg8
LLVADPALGALTVDNRPLVSGTDLAREWYRLRMRERDLLMCSMSVSRRLLVLTGRFSLFRAEVALSHGFIAMVGQDAVYSWRLGRVGMLTGDDKSTWYYTLRQGWRMIYVPDHAVCCLEKLPRPEFVASTTSLMRRYFGNMARSNWRAIRLGPERLGLFTWWSLVDQRISPWTGLWGPVSALSLTVFNHKGYLAVYLCWVLLTRTIQSITFQVLSPTFHPLFPLLKFYNQLAGSGLKVFSFFHPNRQSWTRQKTGAVAAIDDSASSVLHYMSVVLLAAIAILAAMN